MDLEKAIGRLQRIRGDWGGLLDEWRFSRNTANPPCSIVCSFSNNNL